MVFSNKYVLAIITLLLAAGLYFVFMKKAKDPKTMIGRRQYRTLERDTAYSSPNTQGIYRLSYYQGSLLALTKSMALLIDSNLKQESKLLDQNPQGSLLYYSVQNGDTASLDAKGILKVSSGRFRQYKTFSLSKNAMYLDGYFYFYYVSTDSEGRQKAEIRSWNTSTGQVNAVALLDFLFESYTDSEQDCLASQFEGSFFSVDDEIWGYTFHRGSYFILGNRQKTLIFKSLFDKRFVKYKSRTIDAGDGSTDFACQAKTEVCYYYDAGYHEDKIYALSGIVKEPGYADIDVYDSERLKYLYTLTTRLKTQNSYAHILEFVGNSLYLYSNDGEIIKFSKFQ